MGGSLRLGKIFGITINLHWTWFIIFVLITISLSSSFLIDHPLWIRVTIGVATSLLFFASVVAHELAHSLVAIRNGIPVKSITLFFLGGVARITREAARPKDELLMAIAGPLCSLMLSGVFGVIWFLVWGNNQQSIDFDNPVLWLASINLALTLFNLIPGFPLDGGRVLRSILWQSTKNYKKATHIASMVGQGVAYLLIGGGLLIIFGSLLGAKYFEDIDFFNGIWLALVGGLLLSFATQSYRQVEIREALQGFTAQAVMGTDFVAIPPYLSLRGLVQGYVLPTGRRYFLVAEESRLKGAVTFENIRSLPQSQWDITPVSAVMIPENRLISVQPEENALSVLEKMDEHGINEMPVVKEGIVLGIIVRENLLRFIKFRSELKI